MVTVAVKLACLLLSAAPPSPSQWTIESQPGQEDVARQVAQMLPRAQGELESLLGIRFRGNGVVTLCPSVASFREATPGVDHRHTLGVAYPARCTVYLNCEAIERSPYRSFAITLRHELSHVLVGEVERRGHRRVPLWFDEGVAVWSSGKVPLYNPQAFELAVRARSLPRLADLADAFPRNPVQRGVAYEQSESFVRWLAGRHGEKAVRAVLRASVDGTPFADAVRQATGDEVTALEEQWLADITPRWPRAAWWAHVLLHPYSAFGLFGVMTLLALVSFWVYWRRRRRKYREWEAEESTHRAGGKTPWD